MIQPAIIITGKLALRPRSTWLTGVLSTAHASRHGPCQGTINIFHKDDTEKGFFDFTLV